MVEFQLVHRTCRHCGESGLQSEMLAGGLHCTADQCIRFLKKRVEELDDSLRRLMERVETLEYER